MMSRRMVGEAFGNFRQNQPLESPLLYNRFSSWLPSDFSADRFSSEHIFIQCFDDRRCVCCLTVLPTMSTYTYASNYTTLSFHTILILPLSVLKGHDHVRSLHTFLARTVFHLHSPNVYHTLLNPRSKRLLNARGETRGFSGSATISSLFQHQRPSTYLNCVQVLPYADAHASGIGDGSV